MAGIKLSPKDIFEQEFKTSMRGYDKDEVNEFLDDIIKDYENFMAQIQALHKENEKLREQVTQNKIAEASSAHSELSRVSTSATNFDILKRISRLEKEVFGKQIIE
ncbi:cell division regulator GpsB [Streptococcus pacificus]|uniref:Cell cycle protein GpsB n=1 Tax=Streptococcus pacificus TaxID=2740577 RepID=A0ABS0ZGK2_9STRE|nr:cell division regulator GpsB [Streptococcus pacificus]MBJ8325152.1 cell division regulator GpsB [Streptococcus pacificus]